MRISFVWWCVYMYLLSHNNNCSSSFANNNAHAWPHFTYIHIDEYIELRVRAVGRWRIMSIIGHQGTKRGKYVVSARISFRARAPMFTTQSDHIRVYELHASKNTLEYKDSARQRSQLWSLLMCCNETYPNGKYLLITLDLLKLAYFDSATICLYIAALQQANDAWAAQRHTHTQSDGNLIRERDSFEELRTDNGSTLRPPLSS